MRLYTNCNNCKKEIRFSSWESDRGKLSKSKGNRIELTCNSCGQRDYYHVNKIQATESIFAQIIGIIIFIIGTPLLLIWIWDYIFRIAYIYAFAGLIGLIGIPFMIYSVIQKEQNKKIRQFNNYKVRE